MLGTCLENVRKTVPLVHNITNYVTVNDVANVAARLRGQSHHVRRRRKTWRTSPPFAAG